MFSLLHRFVWSACCCAFLMIALAAPLPAERYFLPPNQGGTVLEVDAAARRWVAECAEPNCIRLCSETHQQTLQLPLACVRGVVFVGDTPVVWGTDAAERMPLLAVHPQTLAVQPCKWAKAWVNVVAVTEREGCTGVVMQTAEQPAPTAPLLFVPCREGTWGEPEPLHQPQDGEVTWSFDPQGKLTALLRWLPDGSKELAAEHNGVWKTVYRVGAGESLNLMRAGQGCVHFLHDDGAEFARISVWRGATDTIADMAPDGRGDTCGMLLAADGVSLLGITALWEAEHYHAITPHPAVSGFLRAAAQAGADAVPLRLSTDGKRVVGRMVRPSGHAYQAVYDTETQQLLPLEPTEPAVPLLPTRFAEYPARDGTRIPVYYTLPEGQGPFPTVLFLHGGPRMRTLPGYDPRVQYLTSCGFAVVQPQFRGSRGWGRSFMQAGYRQWGRGVMQTDVDDCVPWLQAQGIAKRGQIAVFGGSYGGYAAVAALCFSPQLYACGISLFGPQDLVSMVTHADALNAAYLGEERATVGDAATAEGRRLLLAASTIPHVDRIQAPLFLYYGEKDVLVPPADHSAALAAAMTRAGKTLELHTDPAEAHGFTTPAKEARLYEQMLRFLNRYMVETPVSSE